MIKELNSLKWVVLIAGAIIITVVIASFLIEQLRTERSVIDTNKINNATIAISASGTSQIAEKSRYDFINMDNSTGSIIITNSSNNSIGRNNYNAFTDGTFTNKTSIALNGNYNISYTYSITTSAYYYNISTGGLNFFQNMTKQTPLLGTLLVFLVLASIALGIFAFMGKGKPKM